MKVNCRQIVHLGQIKNIKLLRAVSDGLKQIRVTKKLTQEQVFNDTGIHIARVETAKYNISISTLDALCKYYGVTLKEFFDYLSKNK
jgi:transcriptional regulator with XRE-family HTH domain